MLFSKINKFDWIYFMKKKKNYLQSMKKNRKKCDKGELQK